MQYIFTGGLSASQLVWDVFASDPTLVLSFMVLQCTAFFAIHNELVSST